MYDIFFMLAIKRSFFFMSNFRSSKKEGWRHIRKSGIHKEVYLRSENENYIGLQRLQAAQL